MRLGNEYELGNHLFALKKIRKAKRWLVPARTLLEVCQRPAEGKNEKKYINVCYS